MWSRLCTHTHAALLRAGFAGAAELGALRKKAAAARGKVELKVPGPRPKRQLGPAYNEQVGAWTLPFMGEAGKAGAGAGGRSRG